MATTSGTPRIGITLDGPGGHVHLEPQIAYPSQCGGWEFSVVISSHDNYWMSDWVKLDVHSDEEAIAEVARQINALAKALGLRRA